MLPQLHRHRRRRPHRRPQRAPPLVALVAASPRARHAHAGPARPPPRAVPPEARLWREARDGGVHCEEGRGAQGQAGEVGPEGEDRTGRGRVGGGAPDKRHGCVHPLPSTIHADRPTLTRRMRKPQSSASSGQPSVDALPPLASTPRSPSSALSPPHLASPLPLPCVLPRRPRLARPRPRAPAPARVPGRARPRRSWPSGASTPRRPTSTPRARS